MNHAFEQSPNGLCAVCGLSMRLCTKAQARRNEKETSESRSKQAVVFAQQVPTSCQVVQICTTDRATLLLTTSGQVFSWGEECKALGRKVNSLSDAHQVNLIPALRDRFIAYISCGSEHVLALLSTFTVWGWGENGSGQLGLGHRREVEEPGVVEGQLKGKVIISLQAWKNSSFAVTLKNELFMWGDNSHLVADGTDISKETGHYGHYLPSEYSSMSFISTPVQLTSHQKEISTISEESEPPEEEVKQVEELAIAVDPEGTLRFFQSKSELEVLSAIISQEAVTSMIQENADLRFRIKELQSRYDYIDFHQSAMPADWEKSEDLKILETEISRLETGLENSERESKEIREKMDSLTKEQTELEAKRDETSAIQKNEWDKLKKLYETTQEDDVTLSGINSDVQRMTLEGINTDERIAQVDDQLQVLKHQLRLHSASEELVKKDLRVHNNMKFMIRKHLSYATFDFDAGSEQRRLDELLMIQREVNQLRVVERIQPPLSPQDLQALASDVLMFRSKLKNLMYPIPSALYDAIAKTRNVLLSHLDLLEALINIKGVDPDRPMKVDERASTDYSWGENKIS